MAYVSKVTAERRDLRELEQVMSAGAQQDDLGFSGRSGSNANDNNNSNGLYKMPLGIEPSGAFAAYVRCCAVVIKDSNTNETESNNNNKNNNKEGGEQEQQQEQTQAVTDSIKGRELWMGDRDGAILIVLAADGSLAFHGGGQTRRMINQFPGTFPTAIGQVTFRDVWVCFKDGIIRAFDIESCKPRFEMKRHCGAITAIEVVESANIVATCSEDFLIYIWEGPPRSRQSAPSTELPKLIGKFAGHTNYVRAMCASPSGHHLFTGGADGTVRCYDLVRHAPLSVTDVVATTNAALQYNTERARRDDFGNPIEIANQHNTRNARDIFYLFLHDVGSMIGVVSKTAVTIYLVQTSAVHVVFEANSGSATNDDVTFVAALYSESTGMLWVSRSDGLIAVYDLHTYDISGFVDAHMNTVVQLIQFATCAATVRVVAASGSTICAKDSNSDVALEDNAQTNDDMKKLVQVFQQQRERRQKTERDLAVQKRQLDGLKNFDEKFKLLAAASLERAQHILAQSRAIQRCNFFVLKRKHQSKSQLCAVAMENKAKAHLSSRYFHDWFRFWCSRRTQDAKKCVQNSITSMTERSLQSRYIDRGLQQLRRSMQLQTAAKRAQVLQNLLELRKRASAFDMWRRWMLFQQQRRRTGEFSSSCLRYSAETARSVAWTSVFVGAHNARTQEVRARLGTAMNSIQERALLRKGYQALLSKRRAAAKLNNKKLMAAKLESTNNNVVRSSCFGALIAFVRERRKQKLQSATDQLNNRLNELTDMLDDENVDRMTPDEVSNLITETEKEVQRSQKELNAHKSRLASLESYIAQKEQEKAAWESLSKPDPKEGEEPRPLVQSMEAISTRVPIQVATYSSAVKAGLGLSSASDEKKGSSPTKKGSPAKKSSSKPAAKRTSSPGAKAPSKSKSPARSASSKSPSRAASPSTAAAAESSSLSKNQQEVKLSATAMIQALAVALSAYPQSVGKKQQLSESQLDESEPPTLEKTQTPHEAESRPSQEKAPAEKEENKTRALLPAEEPPKSQEGDAAESEKPAAATTEETAGISEEPKQKDDEATVVAPTPAPVEEEAKPKEQEPEQSKPVTAPTSAPAPAQKQPKQQQQQQADQDDPASWSNQSKALLDEFEAQKSQPSDSYRAAWEQFSTFSVNANKALALYQVFRSSNSREGSASPSKLLEEPTKEQWSQVEKQFSAPNALADFIARVEFGRAHPELTATPPPPPPPPKAVAEGDAAAPAAKKRTASATKRSSPAKAGASKKAATGGDKKATATAGSKSPAARAKSPAGKTATPRAASAAKKPATAAATGAKKPASATPRTASKPAPKK